MSSKSRWADEDPEAEAINAQRKREKEEKRRAKAEKQRQLEQQAEEAARQREAANNDTEAPPKKRRRLSNDPDTTADVQVESAKPQENTSNILQFPTQEWGPSRHVDNFERLNHIEEGSYGWVSRAKDITTGEIVALKKLKMDNSPDGFPTLLDDMREPFLPSEIKTLLSQVLSGLDFLHSQWIMHRDLKTSNLLMNNRGEIKIADFGMARYYGDPPPKLTQLVVTLWYRAPELLLGAEKYGTEIDMWSIGCIFGELLTKEPLLQGKNEVDQVSKVPFILHILDTRGVRFRWMRTYGE
ncbi:unnamed protein product [Aspergillus oryzae]|uniref:cyclin-dependent kinase n=1 Tax=Aspergillus oryzae TaxID=5062 RepID=A0AAN4YR51_ASPOZ|nr:unnamed protein product [Aspergillus oryzae]GMF87219.1 unnamed protein product [Aspergillus oryzae]GMG14458.1 unnamed protein product [Aspergillus oryzae]GMG34711.1 unnamed protein product [Aspergillus oryzae]